MTGMDIATLDSNPQPSLAGNNFISVHDAHTLWGLFCERVRRSPDGVAYIDHDSADESWKNYTWRAIAARVEKFRAALNRVQLKPGDHIAILLPNGIDWVCLDLAAQASGLVVVGLHPHNSAGNNAHVLGHSDARLIVVDTEQRWQSLFALRSEFPLLKHVWISKSDITINTSFDCVIVRSLADSLAGTSEPPTPISSSPSDIATLIYTSGTTGRPKGVMLSHFALLWNAQASAAIIPTRHDDVFLSILPLAHAFERTVGYYLPMMGGCAVAHARSPQHLREDFQAVRPTAMLGVPLLYARIAAGIQASVASSVLRRNMLRIAVRIGRRRFEIAQQRASPSIAIQLLWSILKPCVASPVLAAFGGRLRVAISGGAPLDQAVSKLLIGLGLPLVEGYGLTEAAPVVAANAINDNLPGSVGQLLRGVEAKLKTDGELMIRSPSVMTGYWKDDTGSARVLDPMGWLSTGDIAEITNGHIFIRGRLKEMIVLSIGEKINPTILETEITSDPLFKQAFVIGDRRPYLIAIIVLDQSAWKRFALEKNLDPELPNNPVSKLEVLARLRSLLADMPWFAKIRNVHLAIEPWTIEAGLLAPTLKIKRNALEQYFAGEIDALYAEQQ